MPLQAAIRLTTIGLLGGAFYAGAASLFTETFIDFGGTDAHFCSHTGSSDSSCSAITMIADPNASNEIRATATAHAEYGYLYVRARWEVDVYSDPFYVPAVNAQARFEDALTFSGTTAIARIQADWDTSGLFCRPGPAFCDVFNSEFPVPDLELGTVVPIWAELAAFTVPDFPIPDTEGTLRLTSIRLFDEEMNQLRGLFYRSASGRAYPVEGATQLPEQPTVALTGIGFFAIVMLRRKARERRSPSDSGRGIVNLRRELRRWCHEERPISLRRPSFSVGQTSVGRAAGI